MFAQSFKAAPAQRSMVMAAQQMRFFGVLPKLPKMELTIRTPYRTLLKDFSQFQRIIVRTVAGDRSIENRCPPRVYLLPPGQFKITGLNKGEGNFSSSDSGLFNHTGGWMHVHE